LRESNGNIVYYRFGNLARYDHIVHAVFTRLGGVSRQPYASLNVGHFIGDEHRAVETNHRLIFQALNLSSEAIVTAHQVQGHNVAVVEAGDGGRVIPQADALVTDVPGIALMLRFADCVPVLIYDPLRRAIGLAHAGWKGTIEGIAQEAVKTIAEAYGSRPEDLVVGIGPSIGPCCYRVGRDVAESAQASLDVLARRGSAPLLQRRSDGSFHFDLWEANRRQLARLGVKEIEVAALCTACRSGEFFSHRAEGGRTGRFAAVLGIKG